MVRSEQKLAQILERWSRELKQRVCCRGVGREGLQEEEVGRRRQESMSSPLLFIVSFSSCKLEIRQERLC